ncbi:hypothetical protein GIB67_015933 [Kingdonia uniflora]|uniref:TF-B3 domain-containing protein n=1 Tax=Kingdonia uniflora TaxID=39325 RepID=A0A7J7PDC8_9MAGN|nr:hypothetical protein GIB67_015933 [Kingdonia uniflora]
MCYACFFYITLYTNYVFFIRGVEMGERCSSCREKEQFIYWTKLQYNHFLAEMTTDSLLQLRIPKKFVKAMGEKLANTVTLTTPSGSSWIVELVKVEDGAFLLNGWQEFVKDLLLKEEDILIFRYDAYSNLMY